MFERIPYIMQSLLLPFKPAQEWNVLTVEVSMFRFLSISWKLLAANAVVRCSSLSFTWFTATRLEDCWSLAAERDQDLCIYIFLLSAAYSSYSSIKYTIRSVTTVSFPCCCCCTTRCSEAFHNLKLPNPHFLYLLSFTSAHICLKFLSFHIIHVDKFGLCLYFTCHYAVHS